jgi:hypothetical protein
MVFSFWSQTYDREINNIFTVQDEIARAVTQALQVKLLGTNGQPVPSNLRSANLEAGICFSRRLSPLKRDSQPEL